MRSSPSLVESDDAVALVRLVTRRLFIAVAPAAPAPRVDA